MPNGSTSPSYAFPRAHRLATKAQFQAVYDARIKDTRGALVFWSRANDLPHNRLGIAMPKRVGSAPKRNGIKRLLRESFRLLQHDLPKGYDVLINVRPHETMTLVQYQELLQAALKRLDAVWSKRKAE